MTKRKAGPLSDWQKRWSESKQADYYYSPSTRKTVWNKPDEYISESDEDDYEEGEEPEQDSPSPEPRGFGTGFSAPPQPRGFGTGFSAPPQPRGFGTGFSAAAPLRIPQVAAPAPAPLRTPQVPEPAAGEKKQTTSSAALLAPFKPKTAAQIAAAWKSFDAEREAMQTERAQRIKRREAIQARLDQQKEAIQNGAVPDNTVIIITSDPANPTNDEAIIFNKKTKYVSLLQISSILIRKFKKIIGTQFTKGAVLACVGYTANALFSAGTGLNVKDILIDVFIKMILYFKDNGVPAIVNILNAHGADITELIIISASCLGVTVSDMLAAFKLQIQRKFRADPIQIQLDDHIAGRKPFDQTVNEVSNTYSVFFSAILASVATKIGETATTAASTALAGANIAKETLKQLITSSEREVEIAGAGSDDNSTNITGTSIQSILDKSDAEIPDDMSSLDALIHAAAVISEAQANDEEGRDVAVEGRMDTTGQSQEVGGSKGTKKSKGVKKSKTMKKTKSRRKNKNPHKK